MINMRLQQDECMEHDYRGLMGFVCPCMQRNIPERAEEEMLPMSHLLSSTSSGGTSRVPAGAALQGALCAAEAQGRWWAHLGRCLRHSKPGAPQVRALQGIPLLSLVRLFLFTLNSDKCLTRNMVRLGMRSALCYRSFCHCTAWNVRPG